MAPSPRNSMEWLDCLFEHSRSGIAYIEVLDGPVRISRALLALLSATEREDVGNLTLAWLIDQVIPPDRADFELHLRNALAHGQRFELTCAIRLPHGQTRLVTITGVAPPSRTDTPAGVLVLFNEIQPQREAEQHIDIAQRSGFLRFWRCDAEQGAFVNSFPNIHPDDRPRLNAAWEQCLSEGVPFLQTYRHVLPDRTLNAYAEVVANGGNRQVIGVIQDVTQSHALQQSFSKANDELQQFALSLSRELQEPLRAIHGCQRVLARQWKGSLDDEAFELLEFIGISADRMRELVMSLLSYARVSRDLPAPTLVETADALHAALHRLRESVAGSGARIEVGELPLVRGHFGQFVQVFQNLISNAVKYSAGGRPEITIWADRLETGHWSFAVRDRGIGIPPEAHEHIFGLMKRLHSNRYPGTGLGLAICRRIIERHGGKIWVESQPGQGATFRFTLPAEPSPERKGPPA